VLRGFAGSRSMGTMVALGWYEVIKFFHILLAIVAVGFNATYGIWLARAAAHPVHPLRRALRESSSVRRPPPDPEEEHR
jgi:hypothetical protein